MSQSAIVVQNLVKTFERRRQAPIRAVDGLSFSIRRGSIFGLLGPNGAGKTTTLRVLTTLTRPTEGDVSVEGFDVLKHPLDVRRRISVVVQENAAELFLSVRDNLATFGRFHGLSSATIRARAAYVLEQFGLTAEAGRKVMDLSGGFKRRVQVAKVFMVDTPVVFLDEFSTGMDPLLKRSIMTRLREEAARGRTIVLTTQILSEAEELCDDILIINGGRQAARGDVNTLKLLSAGLYDVTVTFDRLPDAIASGLEAFRPLRITSNQNTIVVTLKEQESRVVDIVGYLASKGRVLRLEVTGASLEDVFVELTTAGRTPEAGGQHSRPRATEHMPSSGGGAARE
jgi:ABC-2 type transport system ATP-binding protein